MLLADLTIMPSMWFFKIYFYLLTFIVSPRILSKLKTDFICFTASEINLWFVKEEHVIKCFV